METPIARPLDRVTFDAGLPITTRLERLRRRWRRVLASWRGDRSARVTRVPSSNAVVHRYDHRAFDPTMLECREVLFGDPSSAAAPTGLSSVGPFAIPERVVLSCLTDGTIHVAVEYFGDEPLLRTGVPVPGRPGLWVLVGRNSGRVRGLVAEPHASVAIRALQLPLGIGQTWVADVRWSRSAARTSVAIVNSLLATLPPSLLIEWRDMLTAAA